jgi:hypothetical protein
LKNHFKNGDWILLDLLNLQVDSQTTDIVRWPFDYATKCVEARALRTHAIITAKFLYKYILTKFGCPLTIVIDQGTHFINDVIKYLTDHFILKHTNSIVYYLQGNG